MRFKTEGNPIADEINNILPQTQCGQCGYPGCRPYAEAIANGEDINKCPPGGEAGIQALADLLDVEPMPLDEEHGEEQSDPRSLSSARTSASAAPNAYRPVRWTPSWARPSKCTR